MNPMHTKRNNWTCKVSVKVIILSFLGLILYVGLNLLSSTSKMSVIVDMSIKMKSNVADVLSRFVDISSADTVNGSFSLQSFPMYENEREKKEQVEHLQVTDENRNSLLSSSSTDIKLHSTDLERDSESENMKRNKVPTDTDDMKQSKSNETSVGSHSTDDTDLPNLTDKDQEVAALKEVKVASARKDDSVDKLGIVNTLKNARKNECTSCFRHDFKYVIQNEKICEQHSPDQNIDLIILITTTHKNVRARAALRSTWLTHTRNNTANVRYAFLLGEVSDYRYKEAVLQENSAYHDIIKEDFIDTYMNLTYKTIMGFKWAATKCQHAHYVLKTDDDMFVNVPNVLKILGPNSEKLQTTIMGACSTKARPIRNKKSKWFASEASYPEKFYPGFCSGTGYVTSMHVANEVYTVSPNVPFFHLEDVYVSLCIRQLGFKLKSTSGFNAGRPKMDPCLYKGDKLITAHQLSPIMLQLIWRRHCIGKPL